MEINWFTLVAQIINFLILVFLLYRFLYGPIVKAMEGREQKIASRLEEAEEKRAEAEEEADRYREERRQLEANREQMLARAKEEVEARRKELLREMRQEAEETGRQWREDIQREKSRFLRELRLRICDQLTVILRQALRDLADTDLEERVVDVFVRHMSELEKQQKEALAESIRESEGEVVIRTAFGISQETRQRLSTAVEDHILDGDALKARYEESAELVCGIELRADGRRLAWTVEDYLETLEENMAQTLEEMDLQIADDNRGSDESSS